MQVNIQASQYNYLNLNDRMTQIQSLLENIQLNPENLELYSKLASMLAYNETVRLLDGQTLTREELCKKANGKMASK